MRVVVFASGGGSNFQSIIDRFHRRDGKVEMSGLVASQVGLGAIDVARVAEIPWVVANGAGTTDRSEGDLLLEALSTFQADLIVLAGYLRLVPPIVVEEWWGRIINIHPALLPAFGGEGMYGSRVHRAVIEAGARVSGVTVHFVDEAYDRGPIIAQWPVPVRRDDTAHRLAARVLAVEHRVLPEVIAAIAAGDVTLGSDGRVEWRRHWFGGERFIAEPTGRG